MPSDLDESDVAIAGGTDALARLTYSGFNQLKLMDVEPCRPFDRSRAGMNIGEGAGMLVLERIDHAARARRDDSCGNRRLRARLRGASCDRARARGTAVVKDHAGRRWRMPEPLSPRSIT